MMSFNPFAIAPKFGRCLPNLASGNPADHDGGTDHVGGALLAFMASGH